jgi:hypothetical protein
MGREVAKIEALPIAGGQSAHLVLEGSDSPWRQGVRFVTDGVLRVAGVDAPQLDLWTDTAPPAVDVECVETDGLLRFYNIWPSGRRPGVESRSRRRGCSSRNSATAGGVTRAMTSASSRTSRSSSFGSRSSSRARCTSRRPVPMRSAGPTAGSRRSRTGRWGRGDVLERHCFYAAERYYDEDARPLSEKTEPAVRDRWRDELSHARRRDERCARNSARTRMIAYADTRCPAFRGLKTRTVARSVAHRV